MNHIRQSLLPLYPAQEVESLLRRVLLEVCGYKAHDIVLNKNTTLSENTRNEIATIVSRLANGEPLQYILGYTTFHDLRFKVGSGILIPRPETEELVQLIVEQQRHHPSLRLLDVGTGSGCIAISLSLLLPQASVVGWDISPTAIDYATENARALGSSATFVQQDALQPWGDGGELLDVIVSNPPYICHQEQPEMHINVLEHEPHLALFVPNDDPLRFYRAIAQQGYKRLRRGGALYFEINQAYGRECVELLEGCGYTHVKLLHDLSGRHRFTQAIKE